MLKSILIVPTDAIVESAPFHAGAAVFLKGWRWLKRRILGMPRVYHAELQRYGDIPAILGQENTFILGELFPHFYLKTPPAQCPYPSCHGLPEGTAVGLSQLSDVIGRVDAVVASVGAGERGRQAIAEARRRDIPVAIIDAYDHRAVYSGEVTAGELCRGFAPGRDFDIYFKNDLPLGFRTGTLLPLAPCPLRPASYRPPTLPKDVDIFYSGRVRVKGQPDGAEVVELVKSQFPRAAMLEPKGHRDFLTLVQYWDMLARAKIILSPSRLAWDSFRHCEAGLAPDSALVAPRPYVETAGPALKDGVNAILYDTEFSRGAYHLVRGDALVDKMKYYLDHGPERERLAQAWRRDVLAGHTVLARSRYILESLAKLL